MPPINYSNSHDLSLQNQALIEITNDSNNGQNFTYPKRNGKELTFHQKKLYKNALSYFNANFEEWNITLFHNYMCHKMGSLSIDTAFIRFIYESWLQQKLSDKIIETEVFLAKLRESHVNFAFYLLIISNIMS